ncbi:CDGSH iron-sulfur domain-containing protein 2A [Pantherophis guttatus]|uniref:CDGSH iron-sulfur domain-containing protein 2 n=1 Tax=Pantherophis guttatus TaxID=94885 RepID=A0A6P9E452_PANGU|nr:CDGSH iron-sulfur domain-containing protein 2A [Pantherophis guttatus]
MLRGRESHCFCAGKERRAKVRGWHGSPPREPEVAQQRPARPRPAEPSPGAMVLDSLARIVKVQLPAYLKRLPLPESVGGFLRLSVSEWLRLLPFLGILALLGYLAIRPFLLKKKQQKDSLINLKIQKENPKVVNEINIEDLCHTKAVYCRCWRSKTFPVCDGSHNKHNESTGDNVGPLILRKKEV